MTCAGKRFLDRMSDNIDVIVAKEASLFKCKSGKRLQNARLGTIRNPAFAELGENLASRRSDSERHIFNLLLISRLPTKHPGSASG